MNKSLLLAGLLWCGLLVTGCTKDEPDPVYPQPASLNEEGTYTVTRLETFYTDYKGDLIGNPKADNPYPNHIFTLKGPSYFQEEIKGSAPGKTTGFYLIDAYTYTLKLTVDQPLGIPTGNYQIDSITDKRLVMHLTTENTTTQVTKTFTVRANRN